MKTEAASEVETECMFSSSKSRDLLLRFSADKAEGANGSDSDEIELGLSLGGCFNSSNHKNRILRTSSIPAILPCEILPLFPLFRTCSLPEEEMQIMARMEGKRKRELEEKGEVLKFRRFELCGGAPANGVSSPAASRWFAGNGPAATLKKDVASERSNSQGFELYGFNHGSEIRFMENSEHNNHKAPTFSPFSTTPISKRISNETLSRKSSGERCMMKEVPLVTTKGDGLNKSMMKEMPLVSTKGDGPNGRRIEGFLYKYGRGEEVRIVCVCHGSFLTPAEFVKHAGGGEVAHPLRHIVVNTKPAALL